MESPRQVPRSSARQGIGAQQGIKERDQEVQRASGGRASMCDIDDLLGWLRQGRKHWGVPKQQPVCAAGHRPKDSTPRVAQGFERRRPNTSAYRTMQPNRNTVRLPPPLVRHTITQSCSFLSSGPPNATDFSISGPSSARQLTAPLSLPHGILPNYGQPEPRPPGPERPGLERPGGTSIPEIGSAQPE